MNLHDFQKLLLNRNEIEQALGINLTQALASDEQYLNDYAMFSTIPLEDVTAIFLGLNPVNQSHNKKHPRYWTVFHAVETAVRRGEINAEVEQEFDINGNEYRFDISLSHDVAKAWAKVHNLQWNVLPYRPVTHSDKGLELNLSTTDTKKDEIIEELRTENAGLKARIVELEAENLSKPDIPTAERAVKSDEIKQYNHVERSTHLQIIGGLVEILAEKVGKFKHGNKINLSAIAQEINKVTADYEDQAKERIIRARLTEALKKIGNEHTESP